MSRLLIGNFDAEWNLVHPGQQPSAALRRLVAELATAWIATAEADDLLWCPGQPEAEFWPGLQRELPWSLPRVVADLASAPRDAIVVPWGWTDQVITACQSAGLTLGDHPAVSVVRAVNSRHFSLRLERELGCGLPGSAWLTSLEAVINHLEPLSVATPSASGMAAPVWVLKADLSHSARERLISHGGKLSPRDRTWIEARLRRDGGVAFEPWVELIEEAGLQWELPAHGPPRLFGVTPLLTDLHGHYRGSLCAELDAATHWADAVEATRAAAQRIQSTGYFGPLGIDACRYRDADGRVLLRPLMDINARWTMGRLSLGWRRLLAPGERGLWRHGPAHATLRHPLPFSELPTRVLPTSPGTLDGLPNRLTHRLELYAAAQSGTATPRP